MKKYLLTSAAMTIMASAAAAGGIDRSGQSIGLIFAETGATGGYAQLSFGNVSPSANADFTLFGGAASGSSSPLDDYTQLGLGVKQQFNDQFSLSLIYDQPFGALVEYDEGLPFVGGFADIESDGLTVLGRYEVGNGFSVHGGIRAIRLEGEIFTAFDGGFNPALLEAESDYDFGTVVGVAYERPDIALRVALTYASAIDVDFSGTESTILPVAGIPSPTGAVAFSTPTDFTIEFPESVNLDIQSGVAEDTLAFANIRWVGWGGFNLTTDGAGLVGTGAPRGPSEYVNFDDDTVTYTIGIGRRLTDQLSVAASYTYEAEGDMPSTTALAPTTGLQSITISGSFDAGNGITIAGGITYGKPGDQTVTNAFIDGGEASFDDNEVVGIGLRVGYAF